MKISIVIAYYNRRKLLIETLKSIVKTMHTDYEIIVIDDASDIEERINDLCIDFPMLQVFCVDKKEKWYYNSGIPYNKGIAKANGDVILLQNPECIHVHDILSYIAKNITDNNYISISTYGIGFGWYNHSIFKPVYYPFCAALTKRNMQKLGGFDERYAMGIGYDDNDLVDRITRLGLQKIIAEDVLVLHQQHPKVYNLGNPKHKILYEKNAKLHQETRKESIIKVVNSYE